MRGRGNVFICAEDLESSYGVQSLWAFVKPPENKCEQYLGFPEYVEKAGHRQKVLWKRDFLDAIILAGRPSHRHGIKEEII